jgi:hypothetical protein
VEGFETVTFNDLSETKAIIEGKKKDGTKGEGKRNFKNHIIIELQFS